MDLLMTVVVGGKVVKRLFGLRGDTKYCCTAASNAGRSTPIPMRSIHRRLCATPTVSILRSTDQYRPRCMSPKIRHHVSCIHAVGEIFLSPCTFPDDARRRRRVVNFVVHRNVLPTVRLFPQQAGRPGPGKI